MKVVIVGDSKEMDAKDWTRSERLHMIFNDGGGDGMPGDCTVYLVDYRCGPSHLEFARFDLIIVYQCREHTINHPDPKKAMQWDAATRLLSMYRVVI